MKANAVLVATVLSTLGTVSARAAEERETDRQRECRDAAYVALLAATASKSQAAAAASRDALHSDRFPPELQQMGGTNAATMTLIARHTYVDCLIGQREK